MEEPEQAPDSSMGRPNTRRWGGIDCVDPVIPTEQELAEWGSALGYDPIVHRERLSELKFPSRKDNKCKLQVTLARSKLPLKSGKIILNLDLLHVGYILLYLQEKNEDFEWTDFLRAFHAISDAASMDRFLEEPIPAETMGSLFGQLVQNFQDNLEDALHYKLLGFPWEEDKPGLGSQARSSPKQPHPSRMQRNSAAQDAARANHKHKTAEREAVGRRVGIAQQSILPAGLPACQAIEPHGGPSRHCFQDIIDAAGSQRPSKRHCNHPAALECAPAEMPHLTAATSLLEPFARPAGASEPSNPPRQGPGISLSTTVPPGRIANQSSVVRPSRPTLHRRLPGVKRRPAAAASQAGQQALQPTPNELAAGVAARVLPQTGEESDLHSGLLRPRPGTSRALTSMQGSGAAAGRHGQHVQVASLLSLPMMSIGRGDAPNQSSVANAQVDSQILALQQQVQALSRQQSAIMTAGQANSPNCQDIPRLPL
ncbi:hypothetical protein WJX84_009507 [Apatococcus fuscideae]|uniref:Uncharacterized protein n=1 Tax=Apatococcus fuscideae TaxID=2026836 RepID=A0AAW1S0T0_9CHLO